MSRALLLTVVLLFGFEVTSLAESTTTNDVEAAQWERIYVRMSAKFTNAGMTTTPAQVKELMNNIPSFRAVIVHPALGYGYDEVPPPTLTNSSAMASVNAFIATNGWNMETGNLRPFVQANLKPIRGLPWREIQEREFVATTCDGILYVRLKGWHYTESGVAFNPRTNSFPKSIDAFQPLTNHWYVWVQDEFWEAGPQIYEGQKPSEGVTNTVSPQR